MKLNKEQTAAATSSAPALLVVAGPGSGKTRTLVARILHLIESGVAPSEISAITFTNAAGNEIQKRVAESLDAINDHETPMPPPTLGYCGTLHGFCLRFLQRHGPMIGLPEDLAVIDQDQAAAILTRTISNLGWKGSRKEVETLIARGPVYDVTATLSRIDIVNKAFHDELLQSGMLTFDAILYFANRLAGPLMLTGLNHGHVLVDEVQDCAPVDFEIIATLNFESRTFFGDPDQAIYSFRGGSIEGINALASNPDVTRLDLSLNYRSSDAVCAVANLSIGYNSDRIDKRTLSSDPKHYQLADALAFFEAPFPNDELREVARRIKDAGTDDFAVLTRTNAHAATATEILLAAGVQLRQREQTRMPEDWTTARAAVAFFSNPYNDVIAHRFLSLTISQGEAESVRKEAIKWFVTIAETAGIDQDVHVQDVPKELAANSISPASIEEVVRRLATLPATATVADLSLAMSQTDETATESGTGGAVSTIHSAKGREWGTVYMPGMEANLFPGLRKGTDTEEERRLFFVGLTRAKRRVVLSRAMHRMKPFGRGFPEPTELSLFVRELGLGGDA